MIEVHADNIYCIWSVGVHICTKPAPPGKIRVFSLYNVSSEAILDHSRLTLTLR